MKDKERVLSPVKDKVRTLSPMKDKDEDFESYETSQ